MPIPSLRVLVLAPLCLASTPAAAEHVEITIALSATPGEIVTTLGGATATVVFDTDAPPIASGPQSVTFEGISGRVDGVLYAVPAVTDPSASNDAPIRVSGPIDDAELTYSSAGNGSMAVRLSVGGATFSLTVLSPAGPFAPTMTSLPDSPGAYRVASPTSYTVFANLIQSGSGAFASIQRSGSTIAAIGGVSYNVRLVEAPEPPPCSLADLAPPFGVLNFSDVLEYLVAFGAGCP